MMIADTPAALTPAWLSAALGLPVADVSLTPVGTGQMCDSIRLALSYDVAGAGPSSLIAKLPAADPTSRATALSLRMAPSPSTWSCGPTSG